METAFYFTNYPQVFIKRLETKNKRINKSRSKKPWIESRDTCKILNWDSAIEITVKILISITKLVVQAHSPEINLENFLLLDRKCKIVDSASSTCVSY